MGIITVLLILLIMGIFWINSDSYDYPSSLYMVDSTLDMDTKNKEIE